MTAAQASIQPHCPQLAASSDRARAAALPSTTGALGQRLHVRSRDDQAGPNLGQKLWDITVVTRFWREGHERIRNGRPEYVSGHWVDRDDWDRYSGTPDSEWMSFTSGRSWPRRYLEADEPNAFCPVCEEPVWFFRNENGGCAYFDAVGTPWPKHPCMDSRLLIDRTANWQARVEYRTAYNGSEAEDGIGVRDARSAYADWAFALLRAHTLERDVRATAQAVKRAVAATQMSAERTQTKVQRRERLKQARQRLRDLTSELSEAKLEARTAERCYEEELRWLEKFGDS